jgi:hypothetical protein
MYIRALSLGGRSTATPRPDGQRPRRRGHDHGNR